MNAAWQSLRVKNADPVISFKNLRRMIGVLGMVLPPICYVGGLLVEGRGLGPSISSYYYSNVGDVFEGILVGVAIFLLAYRGYELVDDLITTITGVAGLGIALFPCYSAAYTKTGFFQLSPSLSNVFHTICAGSFFLLLAINSIFIFTLTDGKKPKTRNKERRNAIYIACGLVILASLIVIAILHIAYGQEFLDTKTWIFVLETVLLEAFGVSWLVKGETILKDRD